MTILEDTLKRLVDFESGIITCIYEAPPQYCEPLIQIYMAEFSDPVVLDKKSCEIGSQQFPVKHLELV
ncbi:hypothetical protein [Photobacterium leiognathi]|uniref:hypothetical protein n=1 Tax=Photobacterium leiognathi TaxID=553611 RepID=UPI002738B60A|nr:hypothetical protein [Photobacterium leiognathi]